MSEPTKEQRAAALAICGNPRDMNASCALDDVADLLASREGAVVRVLAAAGFTSGTIPEIVGRMLKLIGEFRTERDEAALERDSLREQRDELARQRDEDFALLEVGAADNARHRETIATLTAERDDLQRRLVDRERDRDAALDAEDRASRLAQAHYADVERLTKERDQLKHDLANKATVAGSAMRLKDHYKADLEASRAEVKELRERVNTLHTGHAAGLASMQRTIGVVRDALVEAEGWLDCTNDNEKLPETIAHVRSVLTYVTAPTIDGAEAPRWPIRDQRNALVASAYKLTEELRKHGRMPESVLAAHDGVRAVINKLPADVITVVLADPADGFCINGCTDAAGKRNAVHPGSRYCRAC